MRQFKQAVCLILSIIMIFSAVTVLGSSNDDNTDLNKLMTGLGLYTAKHRMEDESEAMDRKTAASILARFYGVGEAKVGVSCPTEFVDVEAESAYAQSINTVTVNGVMKGYEDKKFRPDGDLSMQEAVRAFVVLLGWKQYIDYKGGGEYADTWMSQAARLGLTKGFAKQKDDYITRGEFTLMLYRAFEAEYLNEHGTDNIFQFEGKEKGLLPDRMNICIDDGTITAVGTAALYGVDAVPDGKVRIGDKVIDTKAAANDFLGHRVKYYCYSENGEREEILYITSYKTDTITIEAGKIDDAKEAAVSYTDENGRSRSVKIENPASVIINGARNSYYTKDDLTPANGSVTFIDADRNGVYETVIIKSYFDMVVRSVYLDDETLYIYENRDFPQRRSVKIDMGGDADIKFYKNGNEVSYSDITQNSVISIVTDEKENKEAAVYHVYIGTKTVTETLESLYSDEDIIKAGGIEYELESDYNYEKMPVNLGETGVMRFNAFGKITAIEYDADIMKYGFLINAWESDEDDMYYIKFFGEDGETKTYCLPDMLTVDGYGIKKENIRARLADSCRAFHEKIIAYSGSDFTWTDATGYEQLIKYSAQKDRLLKLDTILDGNEADGLTFDYYGKGASDRHWVSTYTGQFMVGGNSGVNVTIDSNAKRFRIPDSLGTAKAFASGFVSGDRRWDDIGVFDMDPDVNYAPLLVEFSTSSVASEVKDGEYSKAIILESVTVGLNDDDEVVTIVQGMTVHGNPSKRKLYLADGCDTHGGFDIKTLKAGDFITYDTNAAGEISVIRKAFSPDGSGSLLMPGKYATWRGTDYRFLWGKVKLVRGDFWKYRYESAISDNGDITYTEEVGSWKQCGSKIYKIDKRSGIISQTTIDALKTIEDVGEEEASNIFLYNYDTRHSTLIIYE